MFLNLSAPRIQKDLGTETKTKTIYCYEKSNVYDLYAIALARSTQATVTGIDVVGHLPREISRFCKFFYDYGGKFSAFP